MRKLIAALAISVLPALGAVTMSAAPQVHANCFSAISNGMLSGACNLTPQQANADKDLARDAGRKASGSPVALGQGAFPGPQPKPKP
jgi:hypothetical protein